MFIIEPMAITGGTPIISACTAVYTDAIISCSGDAEIDLLSGQTVFNTSIIPRYDGIIDLGVPITRDILVSTELITGIAPVPLGNVRSLYFMISWSSG